MISIKAPRDFAAGAIFLALGLAFAVIGRRYPGGSAAEMGAGYFPTLLGYCLAGLGAFVMLRSFWLEGPKLAAMKLRPLALMVFAIVLFGLAYSRIGLALSIVLLVVTAAFASPESRLRETLVSSVVLSAGTVLLFVYLLRLPLRVWPWS